ncbi:MAG: SH3 domain-containing protein [Bacillota bacterium]
MKKKILIGVLAVLLSLIIGFFVGMIVQNGGVSGLFSFIRTGESADAESSMTGQVVTVGENTANVYEKPDAKSKVIYSMNPGETATCVKEGDTWLKLEIIEGVYGYAHTKLFTLAEGYAAVSDAEPKAVEQEEEKTTYVTPSVNVLDIYASESNESDIVATVEYGTVLELISKGEDWSKVKTLDGEEGYVIASDIETTTYDPDSAYVEVVNKFVNLRAEASVDSEKLGSLNQGETAEYLGEEDGFYKVKTEDGTEGYVSMDYTRLNNGSGDSAADDAENEEDE